MATSPQVETLATEPSIAQPSNPWLVPFEDVQLARKKHEVAVSKESAQLEKSKNKLRKRVKKREEEKEKAKDNKKRKETPKEAARGPPFRVQNVTLHIPRGQLFAIVGSVGSGKSSLLQGLIGEMRRTGGDVVFGGRVGYCQQTAWIQNATVVSAFISIQFTIIQLMFI